MGGLTEILILAAVLFLFGALAAYKPIRRRRDPPLAAAQRLFHWQREHIEAKFVDLAALASFVEGSPRWVHCDFADEVTYVRNRRTSRLSAFVAITVHFAARRPNLDDLLPAREPRPDPEPPFSLGTLPRSATAVFSFDAGRWTTEGNAIFNLSPSETICFYRHDLEVVGDKTAPRPSVA